MPDETISRRGAPSPLQLSSAALSVGIALTVLAGWALNRDPLTQVIPGSIAMNPVTAVAVMALSLGLACQSFRYTPLARILATVAIGIGTVKFAQFLFGIPGGIDQLLFPDQLDRVPGVSPSRIAPNTACALAILGCGLITSGSRSPLTIAMSQSLCVVSAAIASVAAVGYALDVVALYQIHNYIAMALPTSAVVILLSLAVISVNPTIGLGRIVADRGPAGLLARTALPFVVLVPLVVGVLDMAGQRAGLYSPEVGSALALIANVIVNFLLLGGCIVALFASDEDRRWREAITAQSEHRYRQAERIGRVGYWKVDLRTNAVQWSDGFLNICGLALDTPPSVEAVIGVCHPDDAPTAREFITQIDRGNWQFACRVQRPDGEIRHVKSHGVCVHDENGAATEILGVFSDITELEVARQSAETAKKTTAIFLANMSHEIRTPLNGVMGFVELLLLGELTDTQRRHLSLVQDSARALLKLLNDILDISKIEAGRMEIASTPYNVRHGVRQCVRLMTPMAEQKGLELSLSLADLPAALLIDGLRMRQIILNLVGNAVKFTSTGSVSVEVSRVVGPDRSDVLQIAVTDTGVGIPADRLTSIFDSFVQAEGSTARRFGGSGLGLSISHNLAEMMGGTIRVDSVVGSGTRMTLVLPWVEAEAPVINDEQVAPSVAPVVARSERSLRAASILVVEDVDLNRELFGQMIDELGHRHDLAVDGAHACELVKRLPKEPDAWDLILMDLQMPVMDGLAATRAIRACGGRAATIPIIALTASAFEDEIRECHAAGMNDHLAKPVSIEGMNMIIERWRGGIRSDDVPATSVPASAPARRPSLEDRFAVRLRATSERLAAIAAALPAADPPEQARLVGEARESAHFLAGCAGMFGHPALGDLASATERQLTGALPHLPAQLALVERALRTLIAATDPSAPGAVDQRRRA